MIVKIGDTEYTVQESAVAMALLHIEKYVTDEYEKFPEGLKILLIGAARGVLLYAEKREPDKEKKAVFRPPKKADPMLHVVRLLMKAIMGGVPRVGSVIVGTDEANNVVSVGIQDAGTGGGSLSANGNIGIGQDDGGEALGSQSRKIISVPSPLHP